MGDVFEVKEHVIEAGHIRDYPHSTAHSQEEVLYLAIKQYIPKDNPNHQPGDVTIIGAHANGFVKELYEPLWCDLHEALRQQGVRIRGIWVADCAWQGQSGAINEKNLGNDPSWIDYGRDMLHMTNHFRASMPVPLIGIGHSFGGNAIANLALLHPRLLAAIVMIDPVLSDFSTARPGWPGPESGFFPMAATAARRDLWPSRDAAASTFTRSPFYRAWDPRVRAALAQFGLRDTPTKLYPDAPAGSVTLATTKAQEVFTYGRPVDQRFDPATGRRVLGSGKAARAAARAAAAPPSPHPHKDEKAWDADWPFERPDGPLTTARLPALRPSAMYLYGEDSEVCVATVRAAQPLMTGNGFGGSGGVAAGRVHAETLSGLTHVLPFQAPRRCAGPMARWLAAELGRWMDEDAAIRAWYGNKEVVKDGLDEEWARLMDKAREILKARM